MGNLAFWNNIKLDDLLLECTIRISARDYNAAIIRAVGASTGADSVANSSTDLVDGVAQVVVNGGDAGEVNLGRWHGACKNLKTDSEQTA